MNVVTLICRHCRMKFRLPKTAAENLKPEETLCYRCMRMMREGELETAAAERVMGLFGEDDEPKQEEPKQEKPMVENGQFRFDVERHLYWLGEEQLPSVTDVLVSQSLVDVQFFTDAGRIRGNAVHAACQFDDEGDLDETTLDPRILPYLTGWRKFKAHYDPEFEEIEKPRYHPGYRYAGTPDRVGTVKLPMGRQNTVIDLKSGVKLPAHPIQLAGYTMLVSEDIGSYARLKVTLSKEGKYAVELYPIGTLARDCSTFLSALNLTLWRKENNLTWQK